MNAPLAALNEFEVLDRIGDIDLAAVDTGFFHRAIKQLARRTNERPPLPFFLIAGLFANEGNIGVFRSLAERRDRPPATEAWKRESAGLAPQARPDADPPRQTTLLPCYASLARARFETHGGAQANSETAVAVPIASIQGGSQADLVTAACACPSYRLAPSYWH